MKTAKKVVNIVLNDFVNDSRVLKTSLTLKKSGYEVTTVALHNNALQERETVQGIDVVRIRLFSKYFPRIKIVQLVKYMEFVFRVLVRYWKTDIVHCNDLSALPVGILIKIFGRDVRIIYDAHEYETEVNGLKGIEKKTRKFLERLFIGSADQVITVSNSIANEYARLYAISKPDLVLNCPKYIEQKKYNIFREKLGIRHDQTIFLYQGGLGPGRGIELLLEVFRGMKDDQDVVVFMGYGPFADQLRKESEDSHNIYFHSAVSPEVLLDYTSSADFGVSFIEDISLSDRYCLPNKLFEYLMAGLPVLVSNLIEMKKLVEEKGFGIVADENTVEGFERAILGVRDLNYQQMVNRVFKARKEFCWENQENVLREVYRSLG